jgi:signal transduction histidine kinase
MSKKDSGPRPNYENLCHILHDLAQPLATVTGLVDLLLLEMDERDNMFKEVQLINEQLEKIMTIIGEIRQIVREAARSEATSQKETRYRLS